MDLLDGLDPAHARHAQIHEDEIRFDFARELDRGGPILCLAAQLDVLFGLQAAL